MKDVIYTPFGNFGVKQNNKPVEFNYTIKNYSSNKSSALIRLYVIEVEANDKDSLVCGFEKPIFEKLNKDEHSTTLFVENETLILGLCSINPNRQTFIMATNNEYGFTYKEEKKIMLILCCIEKDKFKDAKKVIEKGIKSEIEEILNIKIKNKKKSKKSLTMIFLFLLLSLLYIIFAFLLIKYKIVSNETLKKVSIGLLGVMLVSFALTNLSTPKEPKKIRKSKKTFLIALLLLTIILTALGTSTYMILCSLGIVKHEMTLVFGLIIIALVILCWFTSEYKIEKNSLNEEVKKKNEIDNNIEKPYQINPAILNFSLMFPKSLKEDFLNLVKKLSIKAIKISDFKTTYQLTKETVIIPYRIQLEEKEVDELTETEKQLLFCIYTRHYDGHIRQKYIKKLLEIELQEWEYPFILSLGEEYVYEILMTLYNNLKTKDNQKLKEFARNNKELLCNGYMKMVNYWNRFYKTKTLNFHNYVGRKLFRECFGYNRKYEKKRWKCACCCNKTIFGYLIHYYNEPCPVCYWQNNNEQNNNSEKEGINKITLKEAKENYQKFGAIKEEYIELVRKPTDKERVKINIDKIFKSLKLELIKEGFIKRKDGVYEYKKRYFKVTIFEEQLIVEKAINIEENVWKTIEAIKLETDNKFLTKEIMTTIKKSCEKKSVKKLKKVEKDKIVEEEINDWNPLNLIKNKQPNGEYQAEIKKITTKLSKLKTEKELREHIEQVFQKLFGENLFANKKKEIEKVTQKIWKRIN